MDQQKQPGGRDEVAARSIVEPGQSVPINELYEHAAEVDFLKISRDSAANQTINDRFLYPESRYMRLFWRPWPITLGFGIAAAALVLLALYIGELLQINAVYAPTWFKLLRVALMFGGFVCLMIAAPLYKQHNWTPEMGQAEYEELESFRDRYSRLPFKSMKPRSGKAGEPGPKG